MASPNAENVAKEVIKLVRSGKIVNFQKIQKKNGYSDKSCKAMKAKQTKTYKRTIEPITDGLWREINRIKNELESRDLSEEKYKELVESLDKLVKNYQLLSGGATERREDIISPERQAILDKLLNDK